MNNHLPYFCVGSEQTYYWEYNERKKFKRLSRQLGKQWKYNNYKNNPVLTKINELGYRSSTIYPTENYYVAIGCSNTYGMFLHEEDRYSNIIEQETSIPVINLGVCSSSAIFTYMNLCKLLSSDYPMPRAIFIQWPNTHRITLPTNNKSTCRITPHSTGTGKVAFKHILQSETCFEATAKFSRDNLHSLTQIPIIDFAVTDCLANTYGVKYIERIDTARDNGHLGTNTNKKIAEYILEKL